MKTTLLFVAALTSACGWRNKPVDVFAVHPDSIEGLVPPGVLGVNGPDKYMDWASASETVTRRLREGGFRIVRIGLVQDGLYHNRDIYPQEGQWQFKTEDAMLKAIFDAGAEPLVSVIGFPRGVPHTLDGENKIQKADWEAYARFMAGVVRHYNVDHALGNGRRIRYWELWNEPNDEPEGKFVSRSQYAAFVRTVSSAMRKIDPSVRLIGPVHSWSDLGSDGWISFAAKELSKEIDVLCWHDYGGGPEQTDEDRMAWPRTHYGTNVAQVVSGGSDGRFTGSGGKRFGAAITEYNMAWQDGPPEYKAKFHGAFNAAYAGVSLIQAIRSNLELFCFYVFAQAGKNQLGLVDNQTYSPYKPFHVFPLFAKHLGERRLKVDGEAKGLEVLATKRHDGAIVVFVVNATAADRTIQVRIDGAKEGASARTWTVDETRNGETSRAARIESHRISLDLTPFSVTVVEDILNR